MSASQWNSAEKKKKRNEKEMKARFSLPWSQVSHISSSSCKSVAKSSQKLPIQIFTTFSTLAIREKKKCKQGGKTKNDNKFSCRHTGCGRGGFSYGRTIPCKLANILERINKPDRAIPCSQLFE
jgi:hypothetical protein